MWKKFPIISLFLVSSCLSGGYTEFNGSLQGHLRVTDSWLVAVGVADADLHAALPSGVTVSLPLQVREGLWLAIDLTSGETLEGGLLTPLPEGPAALYADGEWDSLIGKELDRKVLNK